MDSVARVTTRYTRPRWKSSQRTHNAYSLKIWIITIIYERRRCSLKVFIFLAICNVLGAGV
ncbi:hypothetical protein BJX66DRAFT_313059 [Aspergillus keveii]|uniref:Uncharacterized protein n=1 Tax=Aspergillus keveii TaxID=714993 RepID=A0ABR4FST5_9EURO